MIEIDKLAVNVALPAIQHDFQASFGVLQWTIGAYMLTLAALLVVGGRLGDILGRRRMFVAGIVVFAGASLLAGVAQTSVELILARALQGGGAAFMYPATFVLVASAYPEERRTRAVAVIATAAGFGMAIGPLVGGLLVQTLSWRWVFFMNPIVALVAIPLTLRFVREERDPDAERRIDVPGVVALTAGLTALMFAFIQAADGSDGTIVGIAVGLALALLGAFVAIERRSPAPLVRFALLRRPAFAGLQVVAIVSMFVVIAWLFITTLELQHAFGASPLATGVFVLPYVLTFFVLARPAGALTDRIGYRVPLVGGLALLAVAMCVLGLAARSVAYDELWYLFVLVGATQ